MSAFPGPHRPLDGGPQVQGHHGDGRQRDVFPLPLLDREPFVAGGSMSSMRHFRKRDAVASASNDVISALNSLYGVEVPSSGCSFVSAAQRSCRSSIIQSVLDAPTRPHDFPNSVEAARELLGTASSYDGGTVSSTVVPYDRSLLSIPKVGSIIPAAVDVLDPQGADLVRNFRDSMLLDDTERGWLFEKGGGVRPYMDERMRASEEVYLRFVEDLFSRGMLRFTTTVSEVCTPFCVKKKNNRQRLVLDCRRSNMHFRAPPPINMPSGTSWASISIPDNAELFVSQSDVADYFYCIGIDDHLSSFFCLPSIHVDCLKKWKVGSNLWDGKSVDDRVYPALKVMPMGWSWAMWVAQRIHCHVALTASGLSESRLILDHSPVPDLSDGSPALLIYCDNLNVVGTCPELVTSTKNTIARELRRVGFRVHEETDASLHCESLGFSIDGKTGSVRPTAVKYHRLVAAFSFLSRRPAVTKKQIERALGHAVHFATLRRDLMCIFRNMYDFAASMNYRDRKRLWPSAARECSIFCSLLPLVHAQLRRRWNLSVTCSDASLSGFAVHSSDWTLEDVVRVGRSEKARFVGELPKVRARESALALDPFTDVSTVLPQAVATVPSFLQRNPAFEEVSPTLLSVDRWQECFAVQIKLPEDIMTLEGRGVVAGVRSQLRKCSNHGCRLLHLTDNLGLALLITKGRSTSYSLLRIVRRLSALCLAADCALVTRWIPSERNPSDAASRRFDVPQVCGGWRLQGSEEVSNTQEAKIGYNVQGVFGRSKGGAHLEKGGSQARSTAACLRHHVSGDESGQRGHAQGLHEAVGSFQELYEDQPASSRRQGGGRPPRQLPDSKVLRGSPACGREEDLRRRPLQYAKVLSVGQECITKDKSRSRGLGQRRRQPHSPADPNSGGCAPRHRNDQSGLSRLSNDGSHDVCHLHEAWRTPQAASCSAGARP
jgi:hypothetical protein